MKGLTVVFAGIAVISLAVSACADDRTEINALYAKLKQYLVTNNPDGILPLEMPDFKATMADGKVLNGKALSARMKQQSAGSKLLKMDIEPKKVDIKGKSANVLTFFSFSSEMVDAAGNMGPKGKKHVMAGSGNISNTLVKTPQGWKFKTMKEEKAKMTMDGKPFDPSKMMAPPPKKKK